MSDRDEDASVARLEEAFGPVEVVGECTWDEDSLDGCGVHPGRGWGEIPRRLRLLRDAEADRRRGLQEPAPWKEREVPTGPTCDVCGPPAFEVDGLGTTECSWEIRRGTHRCEVCARRPGKWRGHSWCCDECRRGVVRRFRDGVL